MKFPKLSLKVVKIDSPRWFLKSVGAKFFIQRFMMSKALNFDFLSLIELQHRIALQLAGHQRQMQIREILGKAAFVDVLLLRSPLQCRLEVIRKCLKRKKKKFNKLK